MKQKIYSRKSKIHLKKIFIAFIVVAIILAILISCKLVISKRSQIEKGSYTEIYSYLDSITADTFREKNSKNENFLVYVGRDTCIDCNEFDPLLIDYLKSKPFRINLYYLNTKSIHENEESWRKFKEKYSIKYTPTFAEFNHGKLVDKIEWTPDEGISIENVNSWFLTKADSLKKK